MSNTASYVANGVSHLLYAKCKPLKACGCVHNGNFSYITIALDSEFSNIFKEVHSLSQRLCVLHTIQGKIMSFTLQEPNAWV